MNKANGIFIPALVLPLMLLGTEAVSQELVPGQLLPELTAEERAARGAANAQAMALWFIVQARQQDHSITDAGRAAGEFFAQGWPAELTPADFVRAANGNWQMWGARTEVLEVSDRHVTARRDRKPTREDFAQSWADVTLEDFEAFMRGIYVAITEARGLSYTETAEDDHIVFTVSMD